MSYARRGLNAYLRWTEKRHLAQAEDIDTVRRSLARRARIFFHGPWGTRYTRARLDDIPVQWAAMKGMSFDQGPMILYFHGGGYVFGSTDTHRAMLATLSKRADVPVCLVEYRLAPEHPFPAAVEDALAAYKAVAGRPVFLGGDSAGGGLALALLGEILRQKLSVPLGVFAFSPLTDMTFSGASLIGNEAKDVMLPAARVSEISAAYLADAAPDDPRASPLFAAFPNPPPVWLTVGSTEILRDDAVRMADHLRQSGGAVTLNVEKNLPHVWPIFHNVLPEARMTLQHLSVWLQQQMGSDGN